MLFSRWSFSAGKARSAICWCGSADLQPVGSTAPGSAVGSVEVFWAADLTQGDDVRSSLTPGGR